MNNELFTHPIALPDGTAVKFTIKPFDCGYEVISTRYYDNETATMRLAGCASDYESCIVIAETLLAKWVINTQPTEQHSYEYSRVG